MLVLTNEENRNTNEYQNKNQNNSVVQENTLNKIVESGNYVVDNLDNEIDDFVDDRVEF